MRDRARAVGCGERDAKPDVATIPGADGSSANVVPIRPDGTIATRITRFTGGEKNAFAGSFSPDGKQIILRLERGDTYSLATVDRDGRNLLAPTKFSTDQPRYIDWGTR